MSEKHLSNEIQLTSIIAKKLKTMGYKLSSNLEAGDGDYIEWDWELDDTGTIHITIKETRERHVSLRMCLEY